MVPVALYEVLDGNNAADYVQRVEPSVQGGRKLSELLLLKAFGRETDRQGVEGMQDDKSEGQGAPEAAFLPCAHNSHPLPVALHIR